MTRLDSLTGLRIFAALMVFARHVSGRGDLDNSEGTLNFLSSGMVGVSFFYIVSGFVLAWTARPGDRPREFYQRRFARIYPLYFVCWLIALGTLTIMQGHELSWIEFIPLTLLQSWVPDETVYFAVSAVFWSLSCEAFFYLVFPWIFPALRRLDSRGRMILVGVIILAIFAIAAVVDPIEVGSAEHWFLYFFPPVRLLEFVLGIMLALQMKQNDGFRFPLWAAITIASVAFFADAFAPGSYQRVAVMVIPFALVVWSAARADVHGLWSPFRGRMVVTLGVWSYAFYLIHAEILVVWLTVLGKLGVREQDLTGLPFALVVVGALILSIAASGILHTLVEAPLERALRPKRRGAEQPVVSPRLTVPGDG